VIGFIGVSSAFSIVVPVLEAPDEPSHVATVRFLWTQRALPIQRPPDTFPTGQEGSQPPLYYAASALIWGIAPDVAIAPTFEDHNPFVTMTRSAEPPDNRNLYAHGPAEAFPWRGDVLAIHLVRLFGVALGAATVLLTFLIARELWPRRSVVAILAAGLVAFNPQFAFSSGTVNNDGAIAMLATFILWRLARWLSTGGSTRQAVVLGVGLGAAMLAKTDGILLLVPTAMVILSELAQNRRWSPTIGRAALVAGLTVVVAGWWFVRNLALYGDLLGWQAMLAANAIMLRAKPLDALAAGRVLWEARGTFWGAFGWTNILFDTDVYLWLDRFSAIALAGLAIALVRRLVGYWRSGRSGPARGCSNSPHLIALAILVIWPGLVFASLVRWVQVNAAADQWRLLFPAIGVIAILVAVGLDELRHGAFAIVRAGLSLFRRVEVSLTLNGRFGLVGAGFLTLTIVSTGTFLDARTLSTVIAPEYQPVVAIEPALPQMPRFWFGNDIELVDYRVMPARLEVGGSIDVDLTWRARQTPPQNWSVAVNVLSDTAVSLAKTTSWPQGGRAPTRAWQEGQVYHEHYHLTPNWDGQEPQFAQVWLNLYDASIPGGPSLSVTDATGESLGTGARLGEVKLRPRTPVANTPGPAILARFSRSIALLDSVRADDVNPDTMRVTLQWEDLQPVQTPYTVFVHVVDPTGKVVAQNDSPPRFGAYPTTAWEPLDTVSDSHDISLAGVPPGTYRVLVGLYLPTTGIRLTAHPAAGEVVVDDGLEILTLMRTKFGFSAG
jgi:hypothetical protein